MPNKNYLKGIKCPRCGQEDSFIIDVAGAATVTDDGIQHRFESDWSDKSLIHCSDTVNCDTWGTVKDFTIKEG